MVYKPTCTRSRSSKCRGRSKACSRLRLLLLLLLLVALAEATECISSERHLYVFFPFGSLFQLFSNCLVLHPFRPFIRGLICQKSTVTTRERGTKRTRRMRSGRKEFEICGDQSQAPGTNSSREQRSRNF